ncbi:hypothetical protein MKW98_011124 [Papaver atlanticum]|uniref:Uncharacterized protein n=1 Tax=Papaver atlanticum TaxID=357466 RepID=A0AAD4XY91_9MAGN|nr:hypothetical protein MKW98_011124 [Papaver atlanticum]
MDSVEVTRFFNPLTTALHPLDRIKMVAKLQREHNLPIPLNEDSLYRPTEWKPRKFDLMGTQAAQSSFLHSASGVEKGKDDAEGKSEEKSTGGYEGQGRTDIKEASKGKEKTEIQGGR